MCEIIDADAADEAEWDAQFAATPDVLVLLADEAHADYEAGLTDDCEGDDD